MIVGVGSVDAGKLFCDIPVRPVTSTKTCLRLRTRLDWDTRGGESRAHAWRGVDVEWDGALAFCDLRNSMRRRGQSVLLTGSQVASFIGYPFHSIRTSSTPSAARRRE